MTGMSSVSLLHERAAVRRPIAGDQLSRSATIGSTRLARRAGTNDATMATASRSAGTPDEEVGADGILVTEDFLRELPIDDRHMERLVSIVETLEGAARQLPDPHG